MLAGKQLGLFAQNGKLSVISDQGPIQVQAQNDAIYLSAAQKLSISSMSDILFAGKKKVTLIGGVTAHELMGTLSAVLLKYEPRLKKITVVLLEQSVPGELRYAIDAELKGIGLVRYGTEFMPEGRVMLRHLKQQQYIETTTRL